MSDLNLIVTSTFLVLVGLLLGLTVGYFWGHASGRSEPEVRERARARQVEHSASGMLTDATSAANQLAELIGLLKLNVATSDQGNPLKSTPEGQLLVGIAQALLRLQQQLTTLQDSSQKLGAAADTRERQKKIDTKECQVRVRAAPKLNVVSANAGGSSTLLPLAQDTQDASIAPKSPAVQAQPNESGQPETDLRAPERRMERRKEARRHYDAAQRFAPYPPGRLPTADQFEEMRCCNISESGLGFICRTAPTTDIIVVTTGEEPDVEMHSARVVSVVEIHTPAGTAFRVGCQFIGRLYL